jgi:2-keto-3-deoxy-L-rhamnonate aldolase RhmA
MHQKNPMAAMLDEQRVPLGMQCFTGDEALIEVLGRTGFDFVMLDSEHCGLNPRAIEGAVRAAEVAGLIPIVRVPHAADETAIRRSLEAGAQGLVIPMVKSAADLSAVFDAAFFPPKGARGICPAVRAAGYSFRTFGEYAQWNNENILLIPLIEHPEAVENIDEICAMDEVKIITFGQGDLAYAMGEGTAMLGSPKVRQAYKTVLAAAERHGVAVMGGPVLQPTPEACAKAVDDGIRVFCLGLDIMGFRNYCESTVSSLNAGLSLSEGAGGWTRPPAPASGFPGT